MCEIGNLGLGNTLMTRPFAHSSFLSIVHTIVPLPKFQTLWIACATVILGAALMVLGLVMTGELTAR